MSSIPNLLTRSTNQIDLMIPRKANISKYRIRGHRTLEGASLSPVILFEAQAGTHYRSPQMKRNRLGFVEDSKVGQTRITFDLDEFTSTSPFVPPDNNVVYLVVEDFDIASGSYTSPSPILIIPPTSYFGVQNSVVTVYGNAPGITATPGETPPGGSLAFGLPLYSASATLKNLDPANSLLVSFNAGMSMVPVSAGDVFEVNNGSIFDIFVASENGSSVPFTMTFSLMKV